MESRALSKRSPPRARGSWSRHEESVIGKYDHLRVRRPTTLLQLLQYPEAGPFLQLQVEHDRVPAAAAEQRKRVGLGFRLPMISRLGISDSVSVSRARMIGESSTITTRNFASFTCFQIVAFSGRPSGVVRFLQGSWSGAHAAQVRGERSENDIRDAKRRYVGVCPTMAQSIRRPPHNQLMSPFLIA
jgi:hypothetical protein